MCRDTGVVLTAAHDGATYTGWKTEALPPPDPSMAHGSGSRCQKSPYNPFFRVMSATAYCDDSFKAAQLGLKSAVLLLIVRI